MNRRQELRKARLTPVVVAYDRWPLPEVLVASEVSPRGLFLASDTHLIEPGELVRLSFRLGTERRFEPEGVVLRGERQRRCSDAGYNGVAVELVDVTPFERSLMRQLLRPVPPPIPVGCRRRREEATTRRRGGRGGGRRRGDPAAPPRRWVRSRRSIDGHRLGAL